MIFAGEEIGKVVAIEGVVKAIGDSEERILNHGSAIYEKETIAVAGKGRAQIQFTDGSLVNLIPETKYKVDAYRYKKVFQKDRFIANLFEGGFRALSGTIAKKNPDEYEVKTPVATMGLRGTIIEVKIESGRVFFGCESGLAVIRNDQGSITIGAGAQSQFSFVSSVEEIPKPLLERPPQLNLPSFSPPKGGFSLENVQAQTKVPSPPKVESVQPQTAPSSEAPQDSPAAAPDSSSEEVETDSDSQTGAETPVPDEGTASPQEFLQMGGGASIQGGC